MDKKQILVIALVALGSLFIAFFTFRFSPGDLEYDFISEDEVCVAMQDKILPGHVEIPSEVTFLGKKNKVTSIGKKAFSGYANLRSVVIPNSVTSIGEDAFWGCTNLQSVVIPNSVMSIEAGAFGACALQNIVLPNSVKSIGAGAFHGCTNLQSVVVPNSVTTIGTDAFHGCTNLQSGATHHPHDGLGRGVGG